MAFDSTVMAAVVAELNEKLLGGRISKIYQPEPDELALLCYSGGANYRLLLSANPRHARLHLTAIEKKNPPAPPTFCMLLRKYIEGGRITAIRQVGRDRICRITINATDELGNPVDFTLVAEVMSKHSNLVLLHPNGRIVDAIRRVSEEVNRYRELLPGLPYIPPPPTAKLDPAGVDSAVLAGALTDPSLPAWQLLLDTVDGLGPMLAKEAVARAGHPPEAAAGQVPLERLAEAVRELAAINAYEPRLLYDEQGRLKEFHVIPLRHWSGRAQTGFPSVSACLDAYYGGRAEEERFRALRGSLAKLVRDEAGRVKRKLKAQRESLQTAESAEAFRIQGELITANLWQIKQGDTEAVVVNYYDPEGAEMAIPLDPQLSPAENAQAYYRRYQKARSGLAMIQEQLAKSEAELAYLEQVEVALEEASSLPDLEEIRRELIAEGYIGEKGDATDARKKKGGEPKGEVKAAPPLTLRSSDGLEIWVGRNNRQNDYLTLKLAAPHDLWFHTKEIPGSHVILRVPPGREVSEQAIHEAAALAAYHSKARQSSGVPVDYTLRKHVRKPSGARPGMVIYDNQKTLWVTPDPELIPILKGGGESPSS
jgi:predicted ribosome quality control (RQC) complex YloA/Tae2 family protein